MCFLTTKFVQPTVKMKKFIRGSFSQGASTTITYLLSFLVRLQPISEQLECDILQRLISSLTHKSVEPPQPLSVSAQDLRVSTNSLTEMKEAERFGVFRCA